MLTREEQQQIIEQVRMMLRQDRQRVTRVQKNLITSKSAKDWEQRDFDDLEDLLKEVG